MTSRLLCCGGATLCAAILLTPPVGAAKPNSDVPLTVIMRGEDALRSDGGTYTHGQQNIRAVLLSNDSGNFIFDTNDNDRQDGGRRLVIDFAKYNGGALGTFTADVFIGTIGANADATDGNLRLLTVGDPPLLRRARIGWIDADGTQYSLRFDGGNHPFLAFSCELDEVTATGRQCLRWTVQPDDLNAVSPKQAALYRLNTTKRGTSETPIGEYWMPFAWTLVR